MAGNFAFYRYHPSLAAAVIFVILFGLTTLFNIIQICTRRTWYFIPLAIGGIFEVVGYIGRIMSSNDPLSRNAFIIQQLLLLVAPALFAASIYIVLGRIIILVDGERYSLIRQKFLTAVFVSGDVISFLVQGAGGAILGSSDGDQDSVTLGQNLVIVGLFVQLFFFAAFVVVAGIFHWRLEGSRSSSSSPSSAVNISVLPWKRHLVVLYCTSALILVRSIFRVAEYLQGNAGSLLGHEVFLYLFDAVFMLGVMIVFNVVHPSQVTEALSERLRGESAGGLVEGAQGDAFEMQRAKGGRDSRLWV
ncbi:RTA1 domain-containing protein [Massarina eburnea CBS 473.64]|uniref:RTA1 domain-containing protein n=1 Tax=Massarina eburnea CBS 473.64 TaxID=1395130 RepID=A0A6A6RJY5_9PLEO|nr:RTA1 domain-containing protein [Massarina eburnea CBS 473.64]